MATRWPGHQQLKKEGMEDSLCWNCWLKAVAEVEERRFQYVLFRTPVSQKELQDVAMVVDVC